MNPDLVLVIGMFLVAVSMPALISAFSADRSLRGAVALAVVGAILIISAWTMRPEGYRPEEIPSVIVSVIADIIR